MNEQCHEHTPLAAKTDLLSVISIYRTFAFIILTALGFALGFSTSISAATPFGFAGFRSSSISPMPAVAPATSAAESLP